MQKMTQDWANIHDRQMNAEEAESAEEDARIKAMERELKRLKKEKKRKQMPKKEEKPKPKAKKMQKSKTMKTRPLLMAPASPLPRTPPPPSPPPSLPVPPAPPPTPIAPSPIPPPLDTLPEEAPSPSLPPPSQKPAPSLRWADREYVPSDADADAEGEGEEEEDQPAEDADGDDDVLFVGVRPATMTTLGALLGTMRPIEERAQEMVAVEQRDAQKLLVEVTMNDVEEAMYGEVVARKMGKVIASYEVRGRGRGQAMPLIQRIIKLCDVCDMAKLLQAKCEAFCPFMYAPFVFGRLVRSAVLFNRRNDYPLDAQQLFFFLFHCF
jgi:hypothetical protein